MRPWALDYLACPRTGSALTLRDAETRDGRIVSGRLVAADGTEYPIVRGIPRMAPGFVDEAEKHTVDAFGREWTHFAEHDDEFGSLELLRQFLPNLDPESVRGRTVVDAGCGTGRWSKQLRALGAARVIALDMSEAAEVCARKLASDENVVVVQGSILEPPLRKASVGVVASIGVVHHLSDPLRGLTALRSAIEPGGKLSIWVYGHEGNELYLAVIGPLRWISVRLPHRLLLALSGLLAAPVWLHARTLNRWVPLKKDGGDRLPMQKYIGMISKLSFRDLTSVVYDQLAPSLARYYRRAEVEALVRDAGYRMLDLHHRTQNSWSVLAEPGG
jgi:SAM-dependent methyltransferase